MNEIYWITRLDMINGWLIAFCVASGILMFITFIVVFVNYNIFITPNTYYSDREDAKVMIKTFKPIRKYSFIAFLILLPLSILIPTKKEAMLIWGVGSTIDYIQDNDTVKQLPDKVVNALDAWVESLSDKEER